MLHGELLTTCHFTYVFSKRLIPNACCLEADNFLFLQVGTGSHLSAGDRAFQIPGSEPDFGEKTTTTSRHPTAGRLGSSATATRLHFSSLPTVTRNRFPYPVFLHRGPHGSML